MMKDEKSAWGTIKSLMYGLGEFCNAHGYCRISIIASEVVTIAETPIPDEDIDTFIEQTTITMKSGAEFTVSHSYADVQAWLIDNNQPQWLIPEYQGKEF